MRAPKALFLTLMLLATLLPSVLAIDEVVDDYEDEDLIAGKYGVRRNSTYNAMELIPGEDYLEDWLEGWGYRVNMTLDSSDISEDLYHFPILVYLNSSSGRGNDDLTFIFDEVGANSLKIAVTEDDGLSECKVEIESWNATSEEAWLWVRAPAIMSDSDTVLYLYFDNDHADNNANVGVVGSTPGEAVWDPHFICVLHLSELAGDFLDSTSNDNDASEQGDGVTRGAQIIDGGIDLAGTNDYARIDTAGIIDGLESATLELWTYMDDIISDKDIVGDWGAGDDTGMLGYDLDPSSKWRGIWRSTAVGALTCTFGTPNPSGSWYHVGSTFVRSDFIYGYENGVETVGMAVPNNPIRSPGNLFYIGVGRDLLRDFDGKVDEVRISSMARSVAWMSATYESGSDDLIDYGIEEELVLGGDGHFYTTDFLSGINYTATAVLFNSTTPGGDSLTVEFSSDNATWYDHDGVLGSETIISGFEGYDLRDLGFTTIYMRFNFTSAGDSTPRLYQIRLIHEEALALAMGKYYALAIILLILGILIGIGMGRRR